MKTATPSFKTLDKYSKEEVSMLRSICLTSRGHPAADHHINYFLKQCDIKKVDPLARMAHLTIRWDKRASTERAIFQMGIDGCRAIAARSGDYAGSDAIEYDTDEADAPNWAQATVWKQVGDTRQAFTHKVRYREFKAAPPNDLQWNKMPYHMIGKCAEMGALRKGWPEDLSGVYDPDEPIHIQPEQDRKEQPLAQEPTGMERWEKAIKAFEAYKIDAKAILARVKKEKPEDLTDEDFTDLFAWYEDLKRGEETA